MGMSKAEIFNMALRHLQITNETIDDPADTEDPLAVIFSSLWDKQIPKELELHDWQFARAGISLSLTETYTSPYQNLGNVYYWPANCLAVRYIEGNTRDDNVPFRVGAQGGAGAREKLIYANRDDAYLIYTQNMTKDYALFSFAFGAALSARLALEYAMFKMGGGDRVKGLRETYAALLSEAKLEDAANINDENWTLMETTRYVASREDSLSLDLINTFSQE